jgi:hypothetical protein
MARLRRSRFDRQALELARASLSASLGAIHKSSKTGVMPRGAKPGERRGGRSQGTPNRATAERARLAELGVAAARARGERLGKETLRTYMLLYDERATYYRTPPHANEAKFEKYARFAVDCARWLAPYESPTFRSIAIAPQTPPTETHRRFTLKVFDQDHRPVVDVTPATLPPVTRGDGVDDGE